MADTAYDVLLMLLPLLLQGLEMLVRDFGYHIAYKRWQDTFTAVPFKPK